MLHSRLKLGRAVMVAGLLALALGACGRKGPLEAPPNATGAIDLPDSQIGAVESNTEALGQTSILARPAKANRAITIPEKAFVLDPLLCSTSADRLTRLLRFRMLRTESPLARFRHHAAAPLQFLRLQAHHASLRLSRRLALRRGRRPEPDRGRGRHAGLCLFLGHDRAALPAVRGGGAGQRARAARPMSSTP